MQLEISKIISVFFAPEALNSLFKNMFAIRSPVKHQLLASALMNSLHLLSPAAPIMAENRLITFLRPATAHLDYTCYLHLQQLSHLNNLQEAQRGRIRQNYNDMTLQPPEWILCKYKRSSLSTQVICPSQAPDQ